MTEERRGPLLYTAQDVAHFCEVDLKTVHHWADRGKVVHHRTEGRHLRFRRNDLVRFLRGLGYPIPPALSATRPVVALPPPPSPEAWGIAVDDLARKLGSRLRVRRYASAVAAVAHLLAEAPCALVLSLDDPSLAGAMTIAALKAAPETAWVAVAAIGPGEALETARAAGAEVTLEPREAAKLPAELARALAVG